MIVTPGLRVMIVATTVGLSLGSTCQPQRTATSANAIEQSQSEVFTGAESTGEGPAGSTSADDPLPESVMHMLARMDPRADPCEDFYAYACGGWIARHENGGAQSKYAGVRDIQLANDKILLAALARAEHSGASSEALAMKHYVDRCTEYQTQMTGNDLPMTWWKQLEAIERREDFWRFVGDIQASWTAPIYMSWMSNFRNGPFISIEYYAHATAKMPATNFVTIDPGAVGMGPPEYYRGPNRSDFLDHYRAHLTELAVSVGISLQRARVFAKDVIAVDEAVLQGIPDLETRMESLPDGAKDVDILEIDELVAQSSGGIDWRAFFSGMNPEIRKVASGHIENVYRVERALSKRSLRQIKAYLWLQWLESSYRMQSESVKRAITKLDPMGREFHESGRDEIASRCLEELMWVAPRSAGNVYGRARGDEGSESRLKEMSVYVRDILDDAILRAAWMDEKTANKARNKLRGLELMVGLQDDRSPDIVNIGDNISYPEIFANQARAHFQGRLQTQGQRWSRNDWRLPASTPQAMGLPFAGVNIGLGFAMPPFYYKEGPMAMNFGGVGHVIAHEFTHCFDIGGRWFDDEAYRRDWWSAESRATYEQRAECIIDQYSQIEVLPGLFLKGRQGITENMSDIGGMEIAYRAYKRWEKEHPDARRQFGPLNADQLFMVNTAQAHCAIERDDALRRAATYARHTPSSFRPLGALRNLSAFAEVFSCPVGADMHPENRCPVWE